MNIKIIKHKKLKIKPKVPWSSDTFFMYSFAVSDFQEYFKTIIKSKNNMLFPISVKIRSLLVKKIKFSGIDFLKAIKISKIAKIVKKPR